MKYFTFVYFVFSHVSRDSDKRYVKIWVAGPMQSKRRKQWECEQLFHKEQVKTSLYAENGQFLSSNKTDIN